MCENHASVAGTDQADTRPGGSVPVSNSSASSMSPAGKTFINSIRLVFDSKKLENRKINHREVFSIINSHFGSNSAQITNISGIGKGTSGFDWIISYLKEIPSNTIEKVIVYKNKEVLIEDASQTMHSYENKRLQLRKTSLLFRITGLPLDVNLNDLKVYLTNMGFTQLVVEDIKQVRDQISNFRTELVKFKIECSESDSDRLVQLSGNKDITLDDFKFKINISCYGFCFACKQSGHTIRECTARRNIDNRECFLCKVTGHLKVDCPSRVKKNEDPVCRLCNSTHKDKVCLLSNNFFPSLSSARTISTNSHIDRTCQYI